VIEAFALGKPVVGARIGGIPELARDGETGYTFEPFDATDLAAKIRFLAGDPAGVERMGRNARKLVEEDLNARKHYEGLMKIYRYAIDKNKRKGKALG
jgi:glycosyltransferase involved in cell wall biosynthesis